MIHPLQRVSTTDPVVKFFTSLGYTVDWDKRGTECWYEIMEKGSLVAQIDMGVPLADIRKDLTCWHKGEEGTSKSDWKANIPDDAAGRRLLKRVANS